MIIIIEEFLYIMESNGFQTMFTENQIINQVVNETVFDENFHCDVLDVFAQIFSVIYIHAAMTPANNSLVDLSQMCRLFLMKAELLLRLSKDPFSKRRNSL